MQYLLLIHNGKKWVADTVITVNFGAKQKGAINSYKKENKIVDGKYWLFPLTHSCFYTFSKGKLIKKRRFYEKEKIIKNKTDKFN